jgi:signal transduction histidine kinase
MTSRTREFARSNVQTEKMMALGKLSAGLAHELNNPASAITRSAKALKGHQIQGPEQFKRMLAITLDPSQIDTITQLLFQRIGYCEKWTMGLLERTEKEEELEQWLEGHGVGNGDELTETLLDFGMDTILLDQIYLISGPQNFPVVIQWMENVLTTHQLVDEIEESAQRIADLVQSVKTYTHMDQAQEREPTDIVKGIQSTLVMLDHKLKRKGIQVDQQYGSQLPWPKIMIGEMNQVWTNLIDNAIDAMENGGKLTIMAERAGQSVQVRIMDNGKGIPTENLHSIFDPFFTTKPIGEGTGMGLEVVKRIIDQHRGEILVESEKGRTVFSVVLPLYN